MTAKDTSLTIRLSSSVKDALANIAEKEHRTLTNMVEFLILEHAARIGVSESTPAISKDDSAKSKRR